MLEEIANVSFRVSWEGGDCVILADDAPFLNEPGCFCVQGRPEPPGSLFAQSPQRILVQTSRLTEP